MNKQGSGKIEYLHYTWGPVSGCLHECEYCYMKRMEKRLPSISMQPAFHPERLEEPLRMKNPSRIGVTFNGDLWGEWVPRKWIEQVLRICKEASWHRFFFLTKNPARYVEFDISDNCWCGTSTTGSKGERKRLERLFFSAPRDRRFISLEPYVGGAISLGFYPAQFDWFIVGGLTGKGAEKPLPERIGEMSQIARRCKIPVFIKANAGIGPQEYPRELTDGWIGHKMTGRRSDQERNKR